MPESEEEQRERLLIVNNVYADYPLFDEIMEDIERCHDSPNLKKNNDPDCLFITGCTGAGKTTIYDTYVQDYPIREEEDGTVVPVVYAVIPPPATIKGLVEVLLEQLGDPLPKKGTTINKTSRLYKCLKDCKVELIFLDEFHHFIDSDSRKVLKNVCDWLKTLIINTKIPVVLFGMPESEKIMTVDNFQLSRRFNYRHSLIPFPNDESGLELFRKFLSDIESQLPLANKSNLAEKSMSERIYYATDGTIAHVMTLIRMGATHAIEHNIEQIDLNILGIIFDKHLRHEKSFKKTDPFSRNKFELEAAYAKDPKFDETTGKRKKDSVKDVFRK
jgi:Bacterial TniB protein